jgi:hypothetical protein
MFAGLRKMLRFCYKQIGQRIRASLEHGHLDIRAIPELELAPQERLPYLGVRAGANRNCRVCGTNRERPMDDQSDNLADDILRGCPAIAAYIGLPERQTFYILQRNLLPAWKEGKFWVSTRSRLSHHYREANNTQQPSENQRG